MSKSFSVPYYFYPFGQITIASNLPDGYKRCKYLASTGTQYIKVGIIPTLYTQMITKFRSEGIPTSPTSTIVCSSRTSWNSNDQFLVSIRNTDNTTFVRFGSSGVDFGAKRFIEIGQDYDMVFDKTGLYLNGELKLALSTSSFSSRWPLYMFGRNEAGSFLWPFQGRIYFLQLRSTDTDTLLRNYIPVLDPNGVPCMYDTVTETPFYNAGVGAFKYELA